MVKHDEGVSAFESNSDHFQPEFDVVLLADDDIKPGVSLSEPVERLVVCESWTDEHNVIKAAANGPVSCFTRNCVLPQFVRPTMSALKGMFPGSISVQHRFKLFFLNVELGIRNDEDVAVHRS